ncbi:MAG: hypothetical protein QNJ46_24545 [Leptolyngbyaceae cyanobacterium MO_188.B28]|nr:hypothetical protein [Leptolyngbyaceae cyanobacterium MO_188.B28]
MIRSTIDCLIAQICLKHHAPLFAKDHDLFTSPGFSLAALLIRGGIGRF